MSVKNVRRSKPQVTPAAAVDAAVQSLTQGIHTFHLADSNASYTYTDADVLQVKAAYVARVETDKADEKLAPCLVRIFGSDWTKEGAAAELKKPLREFIRAVLPDYQTILAERARYAAAAKAGVVDNSAATTIRVRAQGIESKISRMIDSAARLWRNHTAAQDPDYKPEQKARVASSTVKVLETCHAALDKRAGKSAPDSDAARRCAMIVGQLPQRVELFASIMRFGAQHKLDDADVMLLLKILSVEVIGKTIAEEKATWKNRPVEGVK